MTPSPLDRPKAIAFRAWLDARLAEDEIPGPSECAEWLYGHRTNTIGSPYSQVRILAFEAAGLVRGDATAGHSGRWQWPST